MIVQVRRKAAVKKVDAATRHQASQARLKERMNIFPIRQNLVDLYLFGKNTCHIKLIVEIK